MLMSKTLNSTMKWVRKAAIAWAILVVAWMVWHVTRPRDFSDIPLRDFSDVSLTDSPYLRDVVEPITMLQGMVWDDGGSRSLAFKDSRGRFFTVCLMNELGGDESVRLGDFIAGQGRAVPISGIEEKVLLGLLQRWAKRNPDAETRKTEKTEPVWLGLQTDSIAGNESDEHRGNLFALSLIRTLMRRN